MRSQRSDVEAIYAKLAAAMVHRLNNRVSRMVFAADGLTSALAPQAGMASKADRLRRGVADVVGALDFLNAMVRFLAPDAELRRERVDMNELVTEAARRAADGYRAREHTLVLDVPEHGPQLVGDRQGLALVLDNLLANAGKFTTARGQIRLSVETHDARLRCAIRDSGCGIPDEVMRELDDAGDPATDRDEHARHALSSGLVLTRRIVALHGGTLHARPLVEGGTEVVIELPTSSA